VEGLALYRREIERFPEKRVLVLGATPELVDMALELHAETVISVERIPAVMEGMRRVATRDWSSVQMLPEDWLEDRPDFHSAFNCVVCDGGLLFLDYPSQWERLFELVRRNLEPGGVFVAKEWAEPPGDRDYDDLVNALITAFKPEGAGQTPEQTRTAYMGLASELRVATLVNATREDGSFDQRALVDRSDRLLAALERKFPDPHMIETTRAAFEHLARSRPGTMDTVSGVGFEGAEALLQRSGFDCECFPLQDPPVPGGNYMFVAR
jgi:SAM-dependent methyltransferase